MFENGRRVALVFGLIALALAIWGYDEMKTRQRAQTELNNRYQQAFFEAVGHVENVEVLLTKGLVASSPGQLSSHLAELREQAFAAQARLTQLPLVQGPLMQTNKFLSQVGDFGSSLTHKAASGTPPTEDEMQLMRLMKEEAAEISAALHQVQRQAASGQMPWEELRRGTLVRWRKRDLGDDSTDDEERFTRLEERFESLPVIQYDGPYSDHVLQREPKGLGEERVSEAKAEEIALNFADVPQRDEFVATVTRRVDGGIIPAYHVEIRRQGEEDSRIVLDVSEQGGHVVWMMDKRSPQKASISLEEAVERAQAFLEARGFENMIPTYASQAANEAVIPFVPQRDGVLIYPDLTKVAVALDDGRVRGFEGLGYLMAHTERDLERPEVTAEEVLEKIAPGLTVQGDPRLALIPRGNLEEVLTWEVRAAGDGEVYLLYFNALSGEEEQILRLVRTGEGDLTM